MQILPFPSLRNTSRRAIPTNCSQLTRFFFGGMSAERQVARIRELAAMGLSPDFIALITDRGINAVHKAIVQ